jgi:hypothetical protein
MSVAVLAAPRRLAFVPLLVVACFVSMDQQLILFGLNLSAMRILLFAGCLRVLVRNELHEIRWNTLDRVVVAWGLIVVASGVMLEQTVGAFIHRAGQAFNSAGAYFLFRATLAGTDDVKAVVRITAALLVPLALLMAVEYATGRNLYSVFGGVSDYTYIRDGQLRCQGPFRHPILAGTFGATAFPLFLGLWFQGGRDRIYAFAGAACAAVVILTSHSSGPLLSLLAGIGWFLLWPLRHRLSLIKWGAVGALSALALAMKAPVWFLAARLGNITGGTGWHRATLIDAAVNHFGEWWMFGTTYTKHWIPHDTLTDPNMIDITNQYIFEGVQGGVGRLLLFLLILKVGFGTLAAAVNRDGSSREEADPADVPWYSPESGTRAEREAGPDPRSPERFLEWGMAAALVAHAVSFLSVMYFDQNTVSWALLLAMVSATGVFPRRYRPSDESVPADA